MTVFRVNFAPVLQEDFPHFIGIQHRYLHDLEGQLQNHPWRKPDPGALQLPNRYPHLHFSWRCDCTAYRYFMSIDQHLEKCGLAFRFRNRQRNAVPRSTGDRIRTDERPLQQANAYSPTFVTPIGISSFSSDAQLLNADEPMRLRFAGYFTLLSELHATKNASSISVI